MKHLFLLFVFLFYFQINAQSIHSILVQGESGVSLTSARDEFYNVSSTSSMTWTAADLQSYFSYGGLGLPPNSWSLPMLCVNGSNWPKLTAEEVRAYAVAFRFETNSTRRAIYETRAKKGAEFLLWLQAASGADGGIPDNLDYYYLDVNKKGPHGTAVAGFAFYECYVSFGDSKYMTALDNTAQWEINHPSYPYNYDFPNGGVQKYYGRMNHLGRALENLSNAYKITGKQSYLDRAIQIAEEIIAWQDQNQSMDPDIGSQLYNPWPSGSLPDGSWWWENTNPIPRPNGIVAPLTLPGNLAAERKIDYHCLTVDGLISLLESTQQQLLPGTTTIRNGVSFATFRNNLISSIKKAVNYIVDNQETITNSSIARYRGLIKSYKNYQVYGSDNQLDIISPQYGSAPHGLATLIRGYLSLLKTNSLNSQDKSNLESIINSVSESLVGKTNLGWGQYDASILLSDWGNLLNYRNYSVINSNLSLTNLSFEDKNTIWEFWSWDGGGVAVSNNYAHTGNSSVRLLDSNPNASKFAEQITTATPGTTYKAESYARIVNTRQSLYLLFYDQYFNLIDFNHVEVWANSAWEKITVQMTAPTNTAYAAVKAHADWYWTSDGYWDDFSLSVVVPKIVSPIVKTEIPFEYSITNYPNPFNPATTINYQLPESGFVTIKIYDMLGKEVTTLVKESKSAGYHKVNFDASRLTSGVYVYTITANNFVQSKKMMLMK